MKKLIIVLSLMLFSFASASQWHEFRYKGYADITSYKMHYSDGYKHVSMWIKTLNPGDWEPIENKKIWYVLSKTHADCTNKRIGGSTTVWYDIKGTVISNYNPKSVQYNEVVPQSVGETEWEFLCGLK